MLVIGLLVPLIIGVLSHVTSSRDVPDEGNLPYEVFTTSLPTLPDSEALDERYMPVLGNGHLSTTVYSNKMYLNGLYSGTGTSSHRAMVPTIVSPRVVLANSTLETLSTRSYSFNINTGVFTEYIDNPYVYVEHKTYVHHKYIRLLVTDIYALRKTEDTEILLDFKYSTNLNASDDMTFNRPVDYFGALHVRARTLDAEEGSTIQDFNLIQYKRTYDANLTGSVMEANVTMLMSVDKSEFAAKADFDSGRNILNDPEKGGSYLLQEHIDAWSDTWDQGKVEVTGNPFLEKLTLFSQYYLLTSLPSSSPALPDTLGTPSYGQTRTSLAKGAAGADYQGHYFWDSEFYLLPAVLPFYPDLAKQMLLYRSSTFQQAIDNAAIYGQQGARFAWESGYTGADVTPDTCITCRDEQLFVSAAVSWAIRLYYSTTNDQDYFTDDVYKGCDLTREIARFYNSVITYNETKGQYEIKGVTGPDDFHAGQNNNAFINVLAGMAIQWARYFACECGRDPASEVPDDWVNKANNLYVSFDEQSQVHYQYEGYQFASNMTIKQADTILLTFPLKKTKTLEVSSNDLAFYDILTQENTPAMTHSFMAAGWRQVNYTDKASETFTKSYQDYLVQPFKIWTEYKRNTSEGAVNYLPGMGGYLQSLIYGYGGLTIQPNYLDFSNPGPPPGSEGLRLKGLKYLGANLDLEVFAGTSTLTVNSVSPDTTLLFRIKNESTEITLEPSGTIEITDNSAGFLIYPSATSTCSPPL